MDAKIEAWQQYLKTKPLGVGYTGTSDGEMNDTLKNSFNELEAKLKSIGKPISILNTDGSLVDVAVVRSVIDQLPKSGHVSEWKKLLQSKGLYSGDVNSEIQDDSFKEAMVSLENSITKDVPSVSGMIWLNGSINPQASIEDVQEALKLLEDHKKYDQKKSASKSSFAQANLDALGDPSANDFIGTPFQQLFVNQEASKTNNYNQGKSSQNQGAFFSEVPAQEHTENEKCIENTNCSEFIHAPKGTKNISTSYQKSKENASNIDTRMDELINLMESVKK